MRIMKAPWHDHPDVRSGDQLSLGERAADRLKQGFGSWAFLIGLNAVIVIWMAINIFHLVHFDLYPFILLNLGLSWLAAQQGGALQIAANRGDRISAEVALATNKNTTALMDMNSRQLEILERLQHIEQEVHVSKKAKKAKK